MSRSIRIEVGYTAEDIIKEVDKASKKVEDLDRASKQTIRNVMGNIRKATQLGILAAEAVFGSLDAVTRYAIEGGVQIAQLFTTILTAESLINPLFAFKAGVQLASVIAIYVQVNHLIHQRSEMAEQAGRTAIFFRSLGTY